MSARLRLGAAVLALAAPLGAVPAAPAALAPTVQVFVAANVPEGDTGWVAVVLDEPAGRDVSVRVDTRAGTALAPADYRGVHRRVTVPAGRTVVRLALVATADGIDEGPEVLSVRLSRPSRAEISRREATTTIRDRDPVPRVRVVETTFEEPGLGHRLGFTEVRLSHASGRRVEVAFETRSVTAKAGQDFVPLHPTVVFAPGVTSRPVSVELLSDDLVEPPETMRLVVTQARHASVEGRGRITILDAPGG
jgi:hypothetical protein